MTIQPEVRALLTGNNFAHLATTMPDGSPHSVPLWIDMIGDRVVFFTQPTSRKARNIARDPRVAISIVQADNPYRSAAIFGRVVESVDGPRAKEVADQIAIRYTGRPFRKPTTTLYFVEVSKALYKDLRPARRADGDGGAAS